MSCGRERACHFTHGWEMMRVCVSLRMKRQDGLHFQAAGMCEPQLSGGAQCTMGFGCSCEDTISVSIAARIAQKLNMAIKTGEETAKPLKYG